MAKKNKYWIKKAIKKPNALRRALGVKKGKKITDEQLKKAIKKGGLLAKRARLAKTLKKLAKRK